MRLSHSLEVKIIASYNLDVANRCRAPRVSCFISRDFLAFTAALVHLSTTKLLANLSSRPASLDGRRRGEVSIFVFTAGGPFSAF